MKFRKLMAVTLIGMMSASLMACGGNSKETGNKTADGKEKEKLVIWSWGADEEKKSRETMVEAFQKAHPEIEIEHSVIPTADHVWDQKMTAALSAGTGPDVIQMSPDHDGLYTEYYEDLNPYVEKEGVDLNSVVTEGMIEPYYRPDGKLEAMPLLENVLYWLTTRICSTSLVWSIRLLTGPGMIWLRQPTSSVGGEGADATYGMVNHWIDAGLSVICKGGSAYSDDLKTCEVNSQAVKDGLNLFGDLVQSKAMPDDTAAKSLPKEQLFVSGHAAMYTLGGFETKLIAEEVGDNFAWDAVPMPKVENGKNNLMYATGYAMLKTSKNKDAAWTFLKEAAYENEDMAKETSKIGLTSCKNIAETYYKDLEYGPIKNSAFLDGLAGAKLNIWGGAFSAAGDVYTQIWQSVTIDGKSADEAMEEYYPALEKAFNEANGN